MSIVKTLMDSSISDTDVLRALDSQGDDFGVFREVDFSFRCPTPDKAKIVAGFISEYQFGHATATQDDGENKVLVIINMPVAQNIILSVSGFMTCIAELYGVEFEGWGCVAQVPSTQA